MFDVLSLQQQLVAQAAPSGQEAAMGKLLAQLSKPFVDSITVDALGNVICKKEGKPGGKRIMLCAHMDVIGLMATFVDEQGYVWFDNIGGQSPALLLNTRVVFANGTHGVVRPKKLAKLIEKRIPNLAMSDLYIDIGAKNQAEAQKLVALGDMAVFYGTPQPVLGGNIMGPYADDLIGCVTLLLCMEQLGDCKHDVYFVFSTQEEVGCRGAETAAYAIDPDFGIACDVCPTGDTPQNDDVQMAVRLGGGPTIKIRDLSVLCSPEANAHLKATAKKLNMTTQDEILRGGGTDTCRIQRTHRGVPATCISIPTRNIHAPVEIFHTQDVLDAAQLMAAACRNL